VIADAQRALLVVALLVFTPWKLAGLAARWRRRFVVFGLLCAAPALVPVAVIPVRRCRQVGIARGLIVVMAMTLRLDEQETDALRRRAAREGRSMQDVARQAVRDYIDRTSKRELLDDVLDEEIPRYAEALRRLGE